jgi:hypothetical protein
MQQPDEHLLDDARTAAHASERLRAATEPPEARGRDELAAAAFLEQLVERIAPALKLVLGSRRLPLAHADYDRPHPAIALRCDGTFVHVDAADQEEPLQPLQIVRTYPDLTALLARIEVELSLVDPDELGDDELALVRDAAAVVRDAHECFDAILR